MSDIVIRSGGLIEVDTASLREVAAALDTIAREAADIRAVLRTSTDRLYEAGDETITAQWYLTELIVRTSRAAEDAADLAARVRRAADQYEAIDLLVQREFALARCDADAVRRLDRALAEIPLWARAEAGMRLAASPDVSELEDQALWISIALGSPVVALAPGIVRALSRTVDTLGRGRIPTGARLTGDPVPVSVRPVAAPTTATAPASLADAASRIPGGGAARVRVERYTMPSGATQFAVYIAGTQSVGGADAFDATSNLQLYAGEHSASYDAVLAALEQAGAQPGDVVHAFGHSQGAMVGERLATDSPYSVGTVGSFGSPVQADVPDQTLAVSVRHTDDPVPALQGGGYPTAVGAPGSIVVERVADPMRGVHDLSVPAHHMERYVETAAMVDASDDPRVDAVRGVFDELAGAARVEVQEYSAERISPGASGGG